MKQTIRVQLGNSAPSSGDTDAASFLALWRQAEQFFNDGATSAVKVESYPELRYRVRVDVADTLEFLSAVAALDEEPQGFEQRSAAREAAGNHPLTSDITLEIAPVSGTTGPIPPELLGCFLQHLFLTMNLAVPGSLSLLGSRILWVPLAISPSLAPDLWEMAACRAKDEGWPAIKELPFRQTWDWLRSNLPYDTMIAEEPHEKALFALLRSAEPDLSDPEIILFVAQALEALMDCGRENIGTTLRQRLALVLSLPPSGTKWFSKFYHLRSRIAHGDRPVLRPGGLDAIEDPRVEQFFVDYFRPVELALALLLAVVQDLIQTGTNHYVFAQTVERVARHWS